MKKSSIQKILQDPEISSARKHIYRLTCEIERLQKEIKRIKSIKEPDWHTCPPEPGYYITECVNYTVEYCDADYIQQIRNKERLSDLYFGPIRFTPKKYE